MGRETIEKEVQWRVGDGKNISIREDRWLEFGVIGGPANQNDPRRVAELINEENRGWKETEVLNLFEDRIANEILSIPLNPNQQEDTLMWKGNKVGKYTVKSGYNMLCAQTKVAEQNRASISFQPPRTLWTKLWHLSIPPKLRIFMWSICHNAIPTRENLYKRKLLPDPICSLCNTCPETTEHLFLLCKWTKNIWKDPRLNLTCNPNSITWIDKWLMENFAGTRDLPEKELVATVLWFVWKARNNLIFRAKQPDPNTIVDLAQAHLQNFNRWQNKKETAKPPNPNSPRRWIPSEKGQLKLNVDGSWIHGEQVGSVAGILRDHVGQLIDGFAQ